MSLTLLILTLPLLVATALIMRCSSTGPVLHRRQCIGLHGRLFSFNKICIDNLSNPYKRFLKYSMLSHLPALWNILKGDLSIIGTEPRESENEAPDYYGSIRPKRLSVRPGLTGTWRISRYLFLGHSPSLNQYFDEKYVDDVSFLTDIKILIQTFIALAHAIGLKPKRRDQKKAVGKQDCSKIQHPPLRKVDPMNQSVSVLPPVDPFHKETLQTIENIIIRTQAKTVVMMGSWLGDIVQRVASILPSDGIVYDVNMWIGFLPEKLGQQDPHINHLLQKFLANMDQIHQANLMNKIVSLTMNEMEASSALKVCADLVYLDYRQRAVNRSDCHSLIDNTKGIVCGNGWLDPKQQNRMREYTSQHQKVVYSENDFWWIE